MRKLWFLASALAMGMFSLAMTSQARADQWSKSYTVSGHADLHVNVNDGNVTVHSSDQNQITAHVETTNWTIPGDVRITESQNGSHVEIEIHVPNLHFSWRNHSLRLELSVPRNLDLDIHTGDGNISSDSLAGRVQLDTGDGNINANNLAGDVRLHTGDGYIEGTGFAGSLDGDTGDGHIHIGGRFDGLKLHTGDGSIEVRVAQDSKMTSEWTLRTGDGSVTVQLPSNFNAQLDAHTGDGHINLEFPVTVSGSLDPTSLRGKINNGGETLMIRSGDGSIHIEKY
ncbi:MAG: DUF4097 family beta strand repeat-containing protein [Candidatus Acidiferrales bacterium]